MLSPRNFWKPFLLVATAVVALAWTIAVVHIREVGIEMRETAEDRVRALARSHAEQAELTLVIADELLRHLRDTLQRDGREAFRREAARLSGDGAGGPVNRVSLIDADGWGIENQYKGRRVDKLYLGDRGHFLAAQQSREDRIIVSEPTLGKTTGEWVVFFARPLIDDGKFAGAVVVGLPAEYLGRLFDAVDGERELVTLRSPSGRVIASSRGQKEHIGKGGELADDHGGRPFLHTGGIDGASRITAIREIPGWGMRVEAGIDVRALERELARHRETSALPAILLSLLLAPAGLFVYRAGRLQQAAHEALQAETRRSRTVFETMREGILLLDSSGIVTFANARADAWLPAASGRRFADAVRAAGYALVTEDGHPFVGEDPVTLLCLEVGENVDEAWLRRSGSQGETWLALSARALRDGSGAICGATLTMADRSEDHERLMESALSTSIVEGMQDAVMITDGRARILRVNPAFTRLTGFAAAEVIGRTPNILRSERHDDAFFGELWQALNARGQWSGRVWNRRKSGEEYCVWHSITSVRDAVGRIARFITVSRDITEQETRESELWQRANFDPLTGLANRTRFQDRLAQALANAQRNDHGVAVCYLDLDRFKPVNDTLGHAAGDALLKQVAQRMRSVLREEDTLARIGGDEFALLLPRIKGPGDVARVAGKIVDLVHAPFDLPEGTASIGISIGIALHPEDGDEASRLAEAADRALYAAKAGGRNCWRFAERDETNAEPPMPAS